MAMRFPITTLLSEEECYEYLLDALHPEGLRCPYGHDLPDGQAPHDCSRALIGKYRCRECGSVLGVFTGTLWSGTHYNCHEIVLVGGPRRTSAHSNSPMNLSWTTRPCSGSAIGFRNRRLPESQQDCQTQRSKRTRCFTQKFLRMREEKSEPHSDAEDPPRQRANKRRGRGTLANDRPPTLGVVEADIVGRESEGLRLIVCPDTRQVMIVPKVEALTDPAVCLYTDEASAYAPIARRSTERTCHQRTHHQHTHHTVCHSKGEWAADRDGDGIRDVHCNTTQGIQAGLRNFLRTFRGVHKKYLEQYVAMFE